MKPLKLLWVMIMLCLAAGATGQIRVDLKKKLENKVNQLSFKAMRRRNAAHQIEQVGEKLRAMMPWFAKSRLVYKTKN